MKKINLDLSPFSLSIYSFWDGSTFGQQKEDHGLAQLLEGENVRKMKHRRACKGKREQ